MADRRDETWEARADRAYSQVTYHPYRVFIIGFGSLIGLALAVLVIGLVGGWFSGTANLASFGHSKDQTTAVLDDYTHLQAAAGNVCGAQDSKQQSGDPTLVEDPAFAYKATYRRIEADYDRRMNNLFEAYVTRHLPLPGGISQLPRVAPSLAQMEQEVC